MSKTILVLATASALACSMAYAQTPTPGNQMPAPPAPAMSHESSASSAGTVIAAQQPDEWLATRFRGTQVLGSDGAKIGSVDDILFERSGSIKALVIGVGGFLGIGSKEIAVGFKNFEVVKGSEGKADVLTLKMTRDDLNAASEFKPYEPPRPTPTAAPGTMPGAARTPMSR